MLSVRMVKPTLSVVPKKFESTLKAALPFTLHEFESFSLKATDVHSLPDHIYNPGPLPLRVSSFVLYTTVPLNNPGGSGEGEATSSNETRGNTKPLLVVSSSSIEAGFILLGLSPIFTCVPKLT